jgi:hypothetical protein
MMTHALRFTGLALALSRPSAPGQSHGPLGFDPLSPVGAVALVLGMLTLRAAARSSAPYALAALPMLAAAGRNLFILSANP